MSHEERIIERAERKFREGKVVDTVYVTEQTYDAIKYELDKRVTYGRPCDCCFCKDRRVRMPQKLVINTGFASIEVKKMTDNDVILVREGA